MYQAPISRFNSQSTSRTLVGSENGIVSPIMKPVPINNDAESLQSPIIQTSDNRQWIDLDILSPKLLKEVRKQYDPSLKDETSSTIAKGKLSSGLWENSRLLERTLYPRYSLLTRWNSRCCQSEGVGETEQARHRHTSTAQYLCRP